MSKSMYLYGGVEMNSALLKRSFVVIVTVVLTVVSLSSTAIAADGGNMGAWYGTDNSGITYYSSNGTGGKVEYNSSGSSYSALDNQAAGPGYQSGKAIYSTSSNMENKKFKVTPTNGTHKIKFIRYGRIGNLADENKDGYQIGDQKYNSVDLGGEDLTKPIIFEVDIKDGRNRFIWVLFETTTAATFDVTSSIVDDYVAPTVCSTSGNITSTNPLTGIASNGTATVVFNNTSADCELEGISFNNSTDYTTTGVTGPVVSGTTSTYTYNKAITTNSTVKIRFRKKGYLITSTITPADGTCGTVSPVSTTVASGGSYEFAIIPATGCAISQVLVTDQNPAKNYNNTDVTSLEPTILSTGKYTFSNVTQTGNSINVTFVQTSSTLGVGYCQVPPFVGGMSSNKPNVLIIFDTSGSMNDKAYSGKSYSTGSGASLKYNSFYGYFDNTKMYVKDSSNANKYLLAPSTALDLSSTLSGNRLNYDNTEKVDVIRKILVGGKVDSSIVARGASGTKFLKTDNGKLVEYGAADPSGLLQDLIAKVRFGLMVFNANGSNVGAGDGGNIAAPLGSDLATLVSTIESNATDPGGYTPLAESLYEAVRYYQGNMSAYNGVDYAAMDPVLTSCQKHFVLMLTDGEPTNDTNVPGNTSASTEVKTDTAFINWYNGLAAAEKTAVSAYLPRVAYYAHNNDLRTSTVGKDDKAGIQNITLYTVFAFGNGSQTLKDSAKYGAYIDSNSNNKPDVASEYAVGYYEATDGEALENNIKGALSSIISSTASGTAAAVANNKSGERGANMIQALFYPQWPNNSAIKWLGEVQALWYYLDPVINFSGIFEDTNSDKQLDLVVDQLPPNDPFQTKALWRAGAELQKISSSSRAIYTLLNNTNLLTDPSNEFKTDNLTTSTPTLKSKMLIPSAWTATQSGILLNYIRGTDNSLYRSRLVSFTDPGAAAGTAATNDVWKLGDIINSTPQVQSSVAINAYHNAYSDLSYDKFIKSPAYKSRNVVYTGSNDGLFHAFRLGTVSTISNSSQPFRIANMTGTDVGKEEWAFIPSNALPYIQNQAGVEYCHQSLVDGAPTVVDASISNYCSASNYWDCDRVYDATNSSWKTVVVSSMGLGGASRDASGSCNETYSPDTNVANNTDCVKSPVTGDGMSSYFALDVTDPLVPKHLWEFSDSKISEAADKGLGFTTPGSAIVRINAVASDGKVQKKKNGRWFAIMASGPTGAIDSGNLQFTGHSDQNLKIYIVDLNGGSTFTKCTSAGQTNCNYWVKDTGIPFAFANSLNGAPIDLDRWNSTKDGNYSDSVVYITYTKASLTNHTTNPVGNFPSSATAWNKGGIVRLVTNHSPDPFTWFTSSLIDNIGPITTSIGRLQDRTNKKLWVYFGEGRYFFPGDETDIQRRFFGVADPCYTQYGEAIPTASRTADNSDLNFALGKTVESCPAVTVSSLQNQDTPATAGSAGDLNAKANGWYINMAAKSGTAGAERVVSDVTAAFNGVVFYTTFIPNTDPCVPGGRTSVWAVNYNSGGTPSSGSLQGKAPVQTSSGGVKLIDLATSFTENYNRKLSSGLSPMGMAPKGRFPPLLAPKAAKRILNIQEQ